MSKTQPYNVLLIGEDPKQTDLATELVREVADCHVDVISRMESSFDWMTKFNYQLVVIDTSTASGGGFDGIGLLEKIKRISPVTSVILIAEPATVEQAVAAMRMGAEDYLKKPFSVEAFQHAVRRGLDRKAVFSEGAGASNYVHLLNTCQLISGSLEQAKIFSHVQGYLGRELHSNHSAIYSLAAGSEPIRVDPGASEERKDRAMEEVLDIAIHASNPMSGMTNPDEFFRFIDRGQLTPGLFVFRFSCAGDSDYFCVCLSPEKPAAAKPFESRLRMLKAQLEVTGHSIEQFLGVQHLVYVDDATGLYNTRYLHYVLDREIAQAETSRKSFAVLFIDADKFKSVNDTHGHLVGTKLLNELGHHLKKYVRETDTVFRYGGDEFVAVLSPCDLPTANAVAERIRASVEVREFLSNEDLSIHFTVSIGVALFPDHADSKQAVIEAADKAMYSAKKHTRNSVFVAEGVVVPLRTALPGSNGGQGEASGG